MCMYMYTFCGVCKCSHVLAHITLTAHVNHFYLYISCSTCNNGTMNCRKTQSSGENFTLYDLHLLKVQLLKRLYIQKYHGKTSEDNISREMMQVSDQRAIESSPRTLEWKWRNMAKTWRGVLTPLAIKMYAWREVRKLTCFFQLVNNFSKIVDADGVNGVNQTEFIDFFNLSKSELQSYCMCVSVAILLCLMYFSPCFLYASLCNSECLIPTHYFHRWGASSENQGSSRSWRVWHQWCGPLGVGRNKTLDQNRSFLPQTMI